MKGWGQGLQLRPSLELCPGWAGGLVRSLPAGLKPRGPQTQCLWSAWGFCLCCPGFPALGSAGHLASDISPVGGLVSQILLS